MVAPLFTSADATGSLAAMNKFGKAIGMGELGCIPLVISSTLRCKTPFEFKGTISQREIALNIVGT
jgi:hypothetical protein